ESDDGDEESDGGAGGESDDGDEESDGGAGGENGGAGGPEGGDESAAVLDRSAFGLHGLHTGDVGRFDEDGYLYVLNRLDDRIVTGGENVEPGEVVDVLREFPPVEDAAMVGLDDDVWGERVSVLLAVGDRLRDTGTTAAGADDKGTEGDEVTEGDESAADERGRGNADDAEPDNGDADRSDSNREDTEGDESDEGDAVPLVDENQLVSFARDRLAGFKIPKTVAYVDELPRTVSGTVDREAVRRILRERGHDPRGDADLEAAGFEPAEPTEPSDATESDGADEPDEAAESDGADEPDEAAESDGADEEDGGDGRGNGEARDADRDAVDDGEANTNDDGDTGEPIDDGDDAASARSD
ncbi:AMP-dependent synthetase and ligase, partial [Halorubrum kocurii JCM 14978]